MLKECKDCKVILRESVVKQHRLMVIYIWNVRWVRGKYTSKENLKIKCRRTKMKN